MTKHIYHGVEFRRPDPATEPTLVIDPGKPWVAEHGPYRIVVYTRGRVPTVSIFRLSPTLKSWSSREWMLDVCLISGLWVRGSTLPQVMENSVQAVLEHERLHGRTFDNAITIASDAVVTGDQFHHKGTFFRIETMHPHPGGGYSIFGHKGPSPVSLWLSPSTRATIAAR